MSRSISVALATLGSLALVAGLASAPATGAVAAQAPIRINSGGAAGTFEGKAYLADTFAVGGWNSWSTDPVSGTTSSSLYQSRRIAPSGYAVSVANGTYDVTVQTAETWFTRQGARRFSASVEGQLIFADMDLFVTAGHDRAYAATKRVVVTDGRVDLSFSAVIDNAVVAGIEIVPVASPAPVDVVPPVTSVSGGPGQGSVQTSGSASFSLGSDEAGSFQCRFGGAVFVSCPVSYSVSGLGLGVYTLQVRAVDGAGNVDPSPESRTWTVVSATPGASKPEAWNTGVPAGTTLRRHDGDLTITTPGTVIDSLDVYGFVRVQAPNVTIRRSIVRGGEATTGSGLVVATTASASNLVIEDSELVPRIVSPWLNGIQGGNFTLRRVESRGTVDNVGIHLSNVRVESSWLHGTTYFASSPQHGGTPSHNDAIQVHGGQNIRIVGNRLEEAYNAAIMLQQNYSPTSDVVISRNWMNHGGCTVNVNHKGGTSLSGITITDNRFGRDTRNLDCAIIATAASNVATSGNVWDDTGTAVRIRNGG